MNKTNYHSNKEQSESKDQLFTKDAETIAAIATPAGHGGIGIVKISGKNSFQISKKLFRIATTMKEKERDLFRTEQTGRKKNIHHGYIIDPENRRVVDEVLLTTMPSPNTYTREDIVEINAHGGIVALKSILKLVIEEGARLAEPGEFTKRAFLNGRIDLTKAEAVIDIINAKSEKALKTAANQIEGKFSRRIETIHGVLRDKLSEIEVAIDFPEDVEEIVQPAKTIEQFKKEVIEPIKKLIQSHESGHYVRDGIKVMIVGRPNVGKSSLLNAMLKKERAIVTPAPGTTRDFIEETIIVNGIPIILTDCAGIQQTEDFIENIGIEKAKEEIIKSDLILFMVDGSTHIGKEDIDILEHISGKDVILVINKKDLFAVGKKLELPDAINIPDKLEISARYHENVDTLCELIMKKRMGSGKELERTAIIPNVRHKKCLERCLDATNVGIQGIKIDNPPELIAMDLKEAMSALSEITGVQVENDILDVIFSKFCIGK